MAMLVAAWEFCGPRWAYTRSTTCVCGGGVTHGSSTAMWSRRQPRGCDIGAGWPSGSRIVRGPTRLPMPQKLALPACCTPPIIRLRAWWITGGCGSVYYGGAVQHWRRNRGRWGGSGEGANIMKMSLIGRMSETDGGRSGQKRCWIPQHKKLSLRYWGWREDNDTTSTTPGSGRRWRRGRGGCAASPPGYTKMVAQWAPPLTSILRVIKIHWKSKIVWPLNRYIIKI